MRIRLFTHPEPLPRKTRILPVFLSFLGCGKRCVYCAQELQSGQEKTTPAQALAALEQEFSRLAASESSPLELALYGGAFTALPSPWPERFLALAQQGREQGLVSRVRCSTRPDAVSTEMLHRLKSLGLDMVELGVQSFDDTVLARIERGYSGEAATSGCAAVKEAGLELGLHLMPGLPGMSTRTFLSDVDTACSLAPSTIRLHPCLVLDGTSLAEQWTAGEFTPWSMGATVHALGRALPRLWEHHIRVIRMGLAHEPALLPHILAGPWHPSLGNRAKSIALFSLIRSHVAALGRPPRGLAVPRRYTGEIWGEKRAMARAYARLGLTPEKIYGWDKPKFRLI
jgi:histone acetyltransferase (RNA polymerase elongator complex component)